MRHATASILPHASFIHNFIMYSTINYMKQPLPFKRISVVLIWSEDFRKLADWYSKKLGLTPVYPGKYFATFYDLDRNMVQLVGGK